MEVAKIPRARYTAQFRAEALKLIIEKSMTATDAAASLLGLEQTSGNCLRAPKATSHCIFSAADVPIPSGVAQWLLRYKVIVSIIDIASGLPLAQARDVAQCWVNSS